MPEAQAPKQCDAVACINCQWWVFIDESHDPADTIYRDRRMGTCRHCEPGPALTHSGWPRTMAQDWCSRFRHNRNVAIDFGGVEYRESGNFEALVEVLIAYVTQEERAAPYSSSPMRERARSALKAAGVE